MFRFFKILCIDLTALLCVARCFFVRICCSTFCLLFCCHSNDIAYVKLRNRLATIEKKENDTHTKKAVDTHIKTAVDSNENNMIVTKEAPCWPLRRTQR